jgi:hypothetical protein
MRTAWQITAKLSADAAMGRLRPHRFANNLPQPRIIDHGRDGEMFLLDDATLQSIIDESTPPEMRASK